MQKTKVLDVRDSLPCIAPGAAAVAAPFEALLDVAAPIPPAEAITMVSSHTMALRSGSGHPGGFKK